MGRIIFCSAGQYASFGTPMPTLRQRFKMSNFCQIKKGVAVSVCLPIWSGSEYVFWAYGDNTLLLVLHKPSVEQLFQKIVFRQISQISTFSPFGRNSAIWELQHVLFLAQGTNTPLLVPHMPTLKQSFKIANFRKIKKGRGCFCISANLGWFKVCFLSSGEQYASFGTPQA